MAFCVKSVDINAFAVLGTLYELPEGYVMMVGMFQYLVAGSYCDGGHQQMKRSGSLLESLPNPCVGEY